MCAACAPHAHRVCSGALLHVPLRRRATGRLVPPGAETHCEPSRFRAGSGCVRGGCDARARRHGGGGGARTRQLAEAPDVANASDGAVAGRRLSARGRAEATRHEAWWCAPKWSGHRHEAVEVSAMLGMLPVLQFGSLYALHVVRAAWRDPKPAHKHTRAQAHKYTRTRARKHTSTPVHSHARTPHTSPGARSPALRRDAPGAPCDTRQGRGDRFLPQQPAHDGSLPRAALVHGEA